jgi:oxygen-independent coproporphyrinogen-3 oxidase
MIKIHSKFPKLVDEFLLILKLFYSEEDLGDLNIDFFVDQEIINNTIITNVSSSLIDSTISRKDKILDTNFTERYLKRYGKIALFDLLKNNIFVDVKLPWGSLTGIRPTKLYYELIKENQGDSIKAFNILIDDFKVEYNKAIMVREIVNNQKFIIRNDNLVDFYVNIPFCPSKCYYCSFISQPLNKCSDLLEPYIEALIKEIDQTKKLISEKNFMIRSVYVGGGTPTVLSAEQLDRLLSCLNFDVNEFTVECGRPDTITKEKLDVLSKHNVTRISINPQTFCDMTLKNIGRNHNSKDIIEAYKLSLNYNFNINMDLIAGLGNEKIATFKQSIQKVLDCAPDNITIHTLSYKNGSDLKLTGGNVSDISEVYKMIDYSVNVLKENGYKPYYLYKQKNMLGNLENIGYFKDKPCIFNITSMEEFASIIACGANGISKRYYSLNNRIERFANVKNINEYISRVDEMISKKFDLFK